ncbi:MAG: hypothetical protein K6F27_04310 [Ruminococcus sp.]|nr:hypothetical protein [Ruminococcus sp.]
MSENTKNRRKNTPVLLFRRYETTEMSLVVQDNGCSLPSSAAVTAVSGQKEKARKYELFGADGGSLPTDLRSLDSSRRLHYNKNRNTPRFPRSITVLVSADGGT